MGWLGQLMFTHGLADSETGPPRSPTFLINEITSQLLRVVEDGARCEEVMEVKHGCGKKTTG